MITQPLQATRLHLDLLNEKLTAQFRMLPIYHLREFISFLKEKPSDIVNRTLLRQEATLISDERPQTARALGQDYLHLAHWALPAKRSVRCRPTCAQKRSFGRISLLYSRKRLFCDRILYEKTSEKDLSRRKRSSRPFNLLGEKS